LGGTYAFMLHRDKAWFEKTLPHRRPSVKASRACRIDRTQLDQVLSQKIRDLVCQLKSTAARPVRITKCGVLRRSGWLTKYSDASAEFPRTEAVLRECAETRADYLSRKIRWAVAEMARVGKTISMNTLRRKAAVPGYLLRDYRAEVLQTAHRLGANVDRRSYFAQET